MKTAIPLLLILLLPASGACEFERKLGGARPGLPVMGPNPPSVELDSPEGLEQARKEALGDKTGPAHLTSMAWSNASGGTMEYVFYVPARDVPPAPPNTFVRVLVHKGGGGSPFGNVQLWRHLPTVYGAPTFQDDFRVLPDKMIGFRQGLALIRRTAALPPGVSSWRHVTMSLAHMAKAGGRPARGGPRLCAAVMSDDVKELEGVAKGESDGTSASYCLDPVSGAYLGIESYHDGAVWLASNRPAPDAGHLRRGIAFVPSLTWIKRKTRVSPEAEFAKAPESAMAQALLGMELAKHCGAAGPKCARGLEALRNAVRLDPKLALPRYLLAVFELRAQPAPPLEGVLAGCDRALELAPAWDAHAFNLCASVYAPFDAEKARAAAEKGRAIPLLRPSALLERYLASK